MKISVTDNVALQPKHIEILERKGFDVSYYPSIPRRKEEVISRIGKADIAVFDLITEVDKEIIDKCPKIKCLITSSTGYHNVDVKYARKRGITVCNCPDVFSQSVAEFVFSDLISICRKSVQAAELAKNGIWAFQLFQGMELRGKTLGVIGAGNIGSRVIKIAKGLGMRVLVNTKNPSKKRAKGLGIKEFVSLNEILKKSDFISIHIPLNDKTRGLISRRKLLKMKKDMILICLSPYEIVDLEALYDLLLKKRIFGAALDSTRIYPSDFQKSPIYSLGLMNLPNVLITPDMAWYTQEGVERLAQKVVRNAIAFKRGRAENVVSEIT